MADTETKSKKPKAKKTNAKKTETPKKKGAKFSRAIHQDRPVGRPAAFNSPEEMQVLIDKYFKDCEGRPLTKANPETGEEEQVFDKWGFPAMIGVKPPTVTGLALALGFNSRISLFNYEDKPEFLNTVAHAKARIEEYAESRLFDRDGVQGAKFSLANNFKGWSEKQEVKQELTGKDGGAIETESQVLIYIPENHRG